MSNTACGHDDAIHEAMDFLAGKIMPLIEEGMRTAHAAGRMGVSWEEWSKARKNLVVADKPAPPMVNDRPDRHGDGSDAADYEAGADV